MQPSSVIEAANIERLRTMLLDLADATGTIRGKSLWELSEAFNERYGGERNLIGQNTLRHYMIRLMMDGWLTAEKESLGYGLMTWRIQQTNGGAA